MIFTGKEDSMAAVFGVIFDAFKFRVHLDTPGCGDVVDSDGNVIGSAHRLGLNGNWAVHTTPFAGTVKTDDIEFV